MLQELPSLRYTVTVYCVHAELKLTQRVNFEKGNSRAEFSFTPNSQTGPIIFILDIYNFERPLKPVKTSNHSLKDADYYKAFYGQREDGSLAFGGQCTKSPSIYHD